MTIETTRMMKQIQLALFFALLISYTYFLPRWQDPNQNSRIDMVLAVVDDGTFQIDRYVKNTVDYAKVGDHYYSDKAPGAAFVGIPVYALLRAVLDLPVVDGLIQSVSDNDALKATLREDGSGLLVEKIHFAMAQVALTFAAAALPTALMGVLLFILLGRFLFDPWKRVVVVLAYGLLTPAFAYAGAFYGHQLAAACLFAAFYLLFMSRAPISPGALAGAGFLMGYSVISEYPAALVVAVLLIYAGYRVGWRSLPRLGWLLAPAAMLGGGLMLYNNTIFGSPFDLGYGYSELWVAEHSQGFMSLTAPTLRAVLGITISPFRGLFFYSPLLLLGIAGFVLWWQARVERAVFWVALAAVVSIFYFNAASGMWWGGFAVGPRYLLPMLPFLSLPLIFVLARWKQSVWVRLVVVALFAWSLIATWGLTLAEQAFPSDTFQNPLVEYALPNWLRGNIARNLGMFAGLPGLLSLAPLLAVLGLLLGIIGRLARKANALDTTLKAANDVIQTI